MRPFRLKKRLFGGYKLQRSTTMVLGGRTSKFWYTVCKVDNIFAIRRNGFEAVNMYKAKIRAEASFDAMTKLLQTDKGS